MINEQKLKTYQIEIVETLSTIVEIVAKDDATAILKAQERYRKEEVVLYPDDLIDNKYNIFTKT